MAALPLKMRHMKKNHNIYIASDHRGFKLKQHLIKGMQWHSNIIDLGPKNHDPADYPDYAHKLCKKIKENDLGILICSTGIGMSIVANRYKHIRAALCCTPEMAVKSRQHNDANILVLGATIIDYNDAKACLDSFLSTDFEAGRHTNRLNKINCGEISMTTQKHADTLQAESNQKDFFSGKLKDADPEIARAIEDELARQKNCIELIASENIVSKAVLEAQGSIFTNKYAEGYPGRRYYGGCDYVDVGEKLAIERLKSLFGCQFANVQPHSGAQANLAVFLALLNAGDAFLGMSLDAGGHLTHGHPLTISGKWFQPHCYGVDKDTSLINYDEVEAMAVTHKPKLIIAGGSAYSQVIDFKRFREIADKVGALLMVDMAHYAGLIAAGAYPSPVPYADVCTSTTHKTLRGPRGGIILSNSSEIAKKINSAVFPGAQGGPLMHVIAAKAVAFGEALRPEFKRYAQQIIKNMNAMCQALTERGFDLVSGGSVCHLVLVDLRSKKISGADAELTLDKAGITCNKNSIPYDPAPPRVGSGIRLGTAAVTTRGFLEEDCAQLGHLIADTLEGFVKSEGNNEEIESKTRTVVERLCEKHPIY